MKKKLTKKLTKKPEKLEQKDLWEHFFQILTLEKQKFFQKMEKTWIKILRKKNLKIAFGPLGKKPFEKQQATALEKTTFVKKKKRVKPAQGTKPPFFFQKKLNTVKNSFFFEKQINRFEKRNSTPIKLFLKFFSENKNQALWKTKNLWHKKLWENM